MAHGDHAVPAASHGVFSSSRIAKLPEFWSSSPDIWFVRAEGEFELKGVVSESLRHSYVVGALTEEHALMVQDQLLVPDPVTPYTALKRVLLDVFRPSDFQRASQLIEMRFSSAERPSKLLNRMIALLPRGVSPDKPGWLFEAHFLRLLPSDVTSHLVGVSFDSVRAMAKRADELFDARPASSLPAAAVTAPGFEAPAAAGSSPPPAQTADECCAVRQPAVYCWYHASFGDKATRCRSPCAWKKQGNGKGGKR